MQILQKSLACFFVLFFGCFAATAQAPALLKDINNGLASGNPRGMTTVGNTVYFSADDAVHGRELWKTTGTDASTVLVKDISINGSSNPANFCNVNGTVFFTVTTVNNGHQLWKTNGTASGTRFVSDILLGGQDGSFARLTACNGKLFFRSYEAVVPPPGGAPSLELKLHVSDGIETKVLGQTLSMPQNLTAVGTTLFLSGISPSCLTGNQLLKVVGETIFVVKSFQFANQTEFDLPANFINVNGILYFSAKSSAANGRQIWKSTGTTASTTPMTNTVFGFKVSEIAHVNGTVFFAGVVASPNQNSAGNRLFRLNGLNSVTEFSTAGTQNLTAFDNKMVFTQAGQLGSSLSRVTVVGVGVTDLKTFNVEGYPSKLTVAGTTLFFVAGDALTGRELWKSTAAGTSMVQDFMGGPTNANISDLSALGSVVLFASDGIGGTIGGNELRSSNGTLNAIVTVKNIGRAGSFPKEFVKMGNLTFFSATDVDNGRSLWKTDGTLAGTVMISGGINPTELTVVTNGNTSTLFFVGGGGNRQIYKSNGTAAGTGPVQTEMIGGVGQNPTNLTAFQGKLFYTATNVFLNPNENIEEKRLFKSDGTPGNTKEVVGSPLDPRSLTVAEDKLFFSATDNANGRELWRTTVNGLPLMVKNIAANNANSNPSNLIAIGARLFFTVADGMIWVSNTAANNASPVFFGPNASDFTNFNGRLVFTVPSAMIAGQNSIFRVNQDFIGATNLATGSSISSLRAAGTNLFFFQASGGGVLELSKITTTNNTPQPLAIFPEGNTGIAPQMIIAGFNLYFTMTVAATGNELWKSTGTIEGTGPMGDIRLGVGNSNVQSLAVCGADLFFSANNLINGQEPWKLANAIANIGGGGGGEEGDERDAALEVEIPTTEAPQIKVYPNPAANFVNVDLPENELTGTLSILSASGQLVRSVQSSEGESSVQINIQDLQKGVYMVRWVQSDEQVVVKKLIVQ